MRSVFLTQAIGLTLCASLLAGPLNPPAGPVAPTPGPEPRIAINASNTPGDANSVFRISQPGSYYLAGNIAGAVGKNGIEIVASGVTVDLNGFDVAGVPGSLSGVAATIGSLTHIVVVNGSVRGWGVDGIDLSSQAATACRVERVHCSSNVANGIRGGTTALVTNCVATFNGGVGISVNSTGTISDCVSRSNTSDGILCANACVIRNNSCSNNGASGGTGAGIHVTSADSVVENNRCSNADFGILVDSSGNFIARNTCTGNTTNWSVVANNKCLVVLGANAGAISGNSGGVSPGSTDPNANFTY